MKLVINDNGRALVVCNKVLAMTAKSMKTSDAEQITLQIWEEGKKQGIDEPTYIVPLKGTRNASLQIDDSQDVAVRVHEAKASDTACPSRCTPS